MQRRVAIAFKLRPQPFMNRTAHWHLVWRGRRKKKVIKHSICALAFKGRRRVLEELSDNRGGHGRKNVLLSQGPELCFVGGGVQRDEEMQQMHNKTHSEIARFQMFSAPSPCWYFWNEFLRLQWDQLRRRKDKANENRSSEHAHALSVISSRGIKSACQRPSSHACECVAPSFNPMPSRTEPSRAGVKTAAYQVRFGGAVKIFSPHEALASNGSLKADACVERIRNTDSIATAPPRSPGG